MKKNRILSFLLSLALGASLLSVPALAAEIDTHAAAEGEVVEEVDIRQTADSSQSQIIADMHEIGRAHV